MTLKESGEKTLELEKMLCAFPIMSLNYHQIVSRLSKFKIEKSLPAKKVNQENASNFYHVSWPISAMDRVEPSFFALVLMIIKYYKLSFGLLKLSNYL